jgi:hypothetical protein
MRASGLVFAALLVALAGTAWSKAPPATRTFSTGQFVVNCTSTGQVCSPPKKLTLTPPGPGTVTKIRYTTSPQHCSALKLQVLRNGQVVATSKRIEAGQQTAQFDPGIKVPKGQSKLGFRAKGFLGGCNTGFVGSWGGKITVTVTLKKEGARRG